MINLIFLGLLLLLVSLNLGGGLYETICTYPNWNKAVSPDNLVQKLKSSGQWRANHRFWPLVSPLQGLLTLVNLALAWRYNGEAHGFWMACALLVLFGRVITFAFFVPPMLKKFMQPGNTTADHLQKAVSRWTFFSPMRLPLELLAWVLGMYAFHLLP